MKTFRERLHHLLFGRREEKKAFCAAFNKKVAQLQEGNTVILTDRDLAILEPQCKKEGITVVKKGPPYFLSLNHATNELRCVPQEDGTYESYFVSYDYRDF